MYLQSMVALVLLAAARSAAQAQGADEIVRQDIEGPNPDGSYRWAIQTGGGIFHEERGSQHQAESGEPAALVEGQYQYTSPEGQVIRLLYVADENGFRPTGSTYPPPARTPQIQRALDYVASLRNNDI